MIDRILDGLKETAAVKRNELKMAKEALRAQQARVDALAAEVDAIEIETQDYHEGKAALKEKRG